MKNHLDKQLKKKSNCSTLKIGIGTDCFMKLNTTNIYQNGHSQTSNRCNIFFPLAVVAILFPYA